MRYDSRGEGAHKRGEKDDERYRGRNGKSSKAAWPRELRGSEENNDAGQACGAHRLLQSTGAEGIFCPSANLVKRGFVHGTPKDAAKWCRMGR